MVARGDGSSILDGHAPGARNEEEREPSKRAPFFDNEADAVIYKQLVVRGEIRSAQKLFRECFNRLRSEDGKAAPASNKREGRFVTPPAFPRQVGHVNLREPGVPMSFESLDKIYGMIFDTGV